MSRFRAPALALGLLALSLATAGPAGAAAGPTAHTEAASDVSYSSAVLNGSVTNETQGGTYFFQYGTTNKFGLSTPVQPLASSSSRIRITQAITGLASFTTYHFRLVVTGATAGNTLSFTTPKIPLSVAIVAVPNPVVYGGAYTVEGTLSGTGGSDHGITLETDAFPFTGPFVQFGNALLTSSTGGFSFPVLGATENTQLRVATTGSAPVVSPVVTEQVAVKISLHAHATKRRGFARLYGSVEPAEAGALIGFQRVIPGHRTKNVAGTVVKAKTATQSVFSRVVRVHKGVYKALVQVTDGAHVSATSLSILIR